MIDDLIDLILRPQLPTRTPVARLSASLTLPTLTTQFFAFSRASARRCARVFGGSLEGGLELVRESSRNCASSRASRSTVLLNPPQPDRE